MSLNRTAALDMLYSVRVEEANAVRVRISMDDKPDSAGEPTVARYTLYATTAPQRYDYDSTTFEVATHDDVRWVLIDERGEQDQLARYGSGLYATCLSEDVALNGLVNLLWRRLMKRGDA
jgi:hypothetical protein